MEGCHFDRISGLRFTALLTLAMCSNGQTNPQVFQTPRLG